jgi:hypothetical protein
MLASMLASTLASLFASRFASMFVSPPAFQIRALRLVRACAIVAPFLVATSATSAHADGAALLPIMAPDLLEPQKRALDERIRAVAADNGLALQAGAETARSIDDAKKAGAACNIESLACQAQMGVLLGTDQVIVARVASDWAGDRLELRLLDALRGTTLREAARLLPKDPALRARVADGVILAVLAPQKAGSLSVSGHDGPVFLDGVAVASPELVDALAPGPHDLEVRAEGKAAMNQQVVVVSGETTKVELGAKDASNGTGTPPPPATTSTGLWLVGGGAVLAAAAGAGAGGLQAALEYAPMERGTRGALQLTGISLLGATAVGVLVAGAGGVMMAMEGP